MTAILLAAILLVMAGGGIFIYRALVAIVKLLESIDGKLPSSRLLSTLLSLGGD